MTNNGIKTGLILDALYEAKAEDWRKERDEHDYARILYSEFSKIIRKAELTVDPRTVKVKWDLLTDLGIFAHSNKVSAVVDLIAFESYNIVKYTLTGPAHTYIQKPETTEEAGE